MRSTLVIHAPISSAHQIQSAPQLLSIRYGDEASMDYSSVMFDTGDELLNAKLADAINRAIAEHEAVLASYRLPATVVPVEAR